MIPSRHSLPVYIFVRKHICSCLKENVVYKHFVLDLLIYLDIIAPSLVSVNNSTPKDVKN